MASWTDSIPQFNDYVSQQPVDAMRQIGMIRETQHQQGIQKVQSWVDNLLALPIAKQETQQYVKGKLAEVQGAVSSSISGDLSRQRLVNQVGGLMTTISQDPIVQNGVRSTSAIQKGIADLEQAKKDGKWSQQNQDFFNEGVSSWMSDGDIQSVFEDSYTPWVDYQKRFMDVYKEMNSGQNIDGDAFRFENGQLVVNPTLREGISPERIANAWRLVSSQPDVQKQLYIDGWSKYRGIDNQQLVNSLASTTNGSLQEIQSTIRTLQTQLATAPNSQSTIISARIQQLEQQANGLKANADQILTGIASNPDQAKAMLQNQDVLSSLIGTYSQEVMKKSPLWETSMEQARFDREAKEWQLEFDEEVRMNNWKMLKDQMDIDVARQKAAKDTPGTDFTVTNAPLALTQAKGSATAYKDLENTKFEYTQAQRALVSSVAGINKAPYVLNRSTGLYEYNVGKGPNQYANEAEAGKAAYDIYIKTKDDSINGRISDPSIQQKLDEVSRRYDGLKVSQDRINMVEDKFAPQLEELNKQIGNVSQNISFNNRTYTVNNRDLIDVYTIKNNLPSSPQSQARLAMKFGDVDQFISQMVDTQRPLYTGPGSPLVPQQAPLGQAYGRVVSAASKNRSLPNTVQAIEEEYAKLQDIQQTKIITYPTDEKANDINIRNFGAIASQIASLNEESTKGAANDMLEYLRQTDKAAKDNLFQSGFNYETGRGQITVRRGNEAPITLDVPSNTYFSVFPNQRVNQTFGRMYGNRLAVGNGDTSYDSEGDPRGTSYQVPTSQDNPYTVQYHLKRSGSGTNGDIYDVYWWVTPKNGDTPIIKGERMNGNIPAFPVDAGEGDVINWVEKMKDKNWLSKILQWRAQKPNN